ncbi:MAG: glycosyltransferase family 39 protein, partial [Myxococcales bacterium]|nr:glycosyltransferase family 39 protein [Myxococcales bacterium]
MSSNHEDVSSQQQTALHLLFIVGLSLAYESLFVSNGFNPLDDSWPIYALWNLEAGGTLYRDVLWVFPPGHLIPAWIGYHLAPPGLFGARVIYGAFAVASCVGLYLLGRRLMPARFALFAAVLAAVAAPDSHLMHTIFGYRYLIFSMLALLAYARRIETDDVRWLAVAGLWLGVGAFFRLGPVFAAGCGLGVAVMSMHRDPRDWARDWAALALGILAIFVPLLLWAAVTVGLDSIWREIVSRPALMDWRQSLPFPEIVFPDTWHRVHLRQWFVSLQFRAIWLLYGGYFMALVWSYVRAYRERRSFAQPLLVAVWLWGGVFFLRSLTRSDEPHLDSAIPPVLLLSVHGVYSVTRRIGTSLDWNSNGRAWVERGIVVSGVALWIFMHATDTWIPYARRGGNPI